MSFKNLFSALLTVNLVLAGTGPSTYSTLIDTNQAQFNADHNILSLTHWIYTDGEGGAYIKLITSLLYSPPQDLSTIFYGTMFQKKAGLQTFYDLGLCSQVLNNTNWTQLPTVEDYWINEDPFNKGQGYGDLLARSFDSS